MIAAGSITSPSNPRHWSAMSAAAREVYAAVRRDGTQQAVVERMQTRAELYDVLGYHAYEQKLDALFGRSESQP